MTRLTTALATGLAASTCLMLTACGGSTPDAASTSPGGGAATAAHAFPATVKSCDQQLTFTKAPEKVVVINDTDMSILAQLGLLDKVVGRSGAVREAPYDAETVAKIKAIPEIKSTALDSGGTQVATETIIATGADTVIGFDAGVDRKALTAAGINVYSPDAFCANLNPARATFGLVKDEIAKVASMFGKPDAGRDLIAATDKQLAGIPKPKTSRGTVAVLYVMPGSKAFYVYGNSSMVQPIVDANGFRNVYEKNPQRVFDGSTEDLLAHNPDTLVLLYGEGKKEEALPTLMSFAGADKLKAVRDKKVVTMAFSLTDPPTPNSVKGATVLAQELAKK